MTARRLASALGALALIAVIGAATAGTAFAQDPTPTAPTTPAPEAQAYKGGHGMGKGFGMRGGSTEQFDAAAKALNLTPTQLFEQLHSGKSLEEIAKAQGVDLQKVWEAANATRIQAMKDAIAQAVKDGKITQERADWLIQGLDKGYMPMGRGGFDFGRGHGHGRGGMGGFEKWGPKQAPTTPAPGTSS